MSSQRPAWFRFSAMRAPAPPPPAPAPAPVPPRPTGPAPPLGRPAFPFRGPPPPTQTQEPPRAPSVPPTAPPSPPVRQPQPPSSLPPTAPPSPPRPATLPAPSSLPPTAPPSPPAQPPAAPPRSPAEPPAPAASQPRSPVISPSPQPSPPRAPAAPPAAPPRSTVKPPTPRQSPPRTPAAPPSPAKPVPPPSSPFSKETLTSTNYQRPSYSVPTSPKTKTRSPPPPQSAAPSEAANGRATTPVLSSPKMKPLSHPPSPLRLPPPQITTDGGRDHHEPRIEQKTVLVHETNSEKPMKMQHNSHYNHGSVVPYAKREPPTKDKATLSKKSSDHEGHGMRIITVAGDNKGAIMEISQPQKKNYPYTLQTNSKSEEEGKSDNKNRNAMNTQYEPMTAYFNSNVQGINNSIVYNGTIRHKDPGIHLSLTRKARGDHRNKD